MIWSDRTEPARLGSAAAVVPGSALVKLTIGVATANAAAGRITASIIAVALFIRMIHLPWNDEVCTPPAETTPWVLLGSPRRRSSLAVLQVRQHHAVMAVTRPPAW